MAVDISDPVVVSSRLRLPLSDTYEFVTHGMTRWWPYGHRLGDVELSAVILEPVPGGRWYQRDVHGVERELGSVLEVLPPTHVATRSVVGVDYAHDPRGLVTIDIALDEDNQPGCTRVTWTLAGFEALGPRGEELRNDFAGRYGWTDMAEALSSALTR